MDGRLLSSRSLMTFPSVQYNTEWTRHRTQVRKTYARNSATTAIGFVGVLAYQAAMVYALAM
jgi:hypothetical protein